MTVASSSGLNDKDIEKMVADAEKFADEDKARKGIIEMANKADSFCADTDKGTSVFSSLFKSLIILQPSRSMPLSSIARRRPSSRLSSQSSGKLP